MDNVHELCFLTKSKRNDHRQEKQHGRTFDEDNRVAFNALHILSNFELPVIENVKRYNVNRGKLRVCLKLFSVKLWCM